jgi:hypothetical protein
MEDLTHLLPGDPITALSPTSMAGGNMVSDSRLAMTAPGSPPVDPLPPSKEQSDPKITASNPTPIQPGDSGKPKAHAVTGDWRPGPPAWGVTTTPMVSRETSQ